MKLDSTAYQDPLGHVQCRRQSGVVLIAALIALVAMTLAALALVRSMDTGLTIAGNQAFKAAATSTSDVSVDAAADWLKANSAPLSVLYTDSAAKAYYASWKIGCDMTGNETPTDKTDDMQWDPAGSINVNCGAKAVAASGLPDGFTASYIITRMCTCAGAPGTNVCTGGATNVCAGAAPLGREHNIINLAFRGMTSEEQGKVAIGGAQAPYFRVVTRVVGPRSTNSIVETVVTLE